MDTRRDGGDAVAVGLKTAVLLVCSGQCLLEAITAYLQTAIAVKAVRPAALYA